MRVILTAGSNEAQLYLIYHIEALFSFKKKDFEQIIANSLQ